MYINSQAGSYIVSCKYKNLLAILKSMKHLNFWCIPSTVVDQGGIRSSRNFYGILKKGDTTPKEKKSKRCWGKITDVPIKINQKKETKEANH